MKAVEKIFAKYDPANFKHQVGTVPMSVVKQQHDEFVAELRAAMALRLIKVDDPDFHHASYETGYGEGASSMSADYKMALDDVLEEDFSGPDDLAKQVRVLLEKAAPTALGAGEPVAWLDAQGNFWLTEESAKAHHAKPLYAAPPAPAVTEPWGWLCSGKGDGWEEIDKLVRDPELVENYRLRPKNWYSIEPLYLSAPPAPTLALTMERATKLWDWLEWYMSEECNLEPDALSKGERANLIGAIAGELAEPVALQYAVREAAAEFLRRADGLTGLSAIKIDGKLRTASEIADMIEVPRPAAPPAPGVDAGTVERSQAMLDVEAERRRQVEKEGWTPEHDDAHNDGTIARAAAAYARHAGSTDDDRQVNSGFSPDDLWPASWSGFWKPSNRRRDLVKAGALILAEIERLDRALPKDESK